MIQLSAVSSRNLAKMSVDLRQTGVTKTVFTDIPIDMLVKYKLHLKTSILPVRNSIALNLIAKLP